MRDVIGKLLQDNNMPDTPTARAIYRKMLDQRPWVGLTDEDVRQCSRDVVAGGSENSVDRFAYAIEAKLKEKNDH